MAELLELIYRSSEPFKEEHDRCIVTPCSDPYWRRHVDEFFRDPNKGLGLKSPTRLPCAGGVGGALSESSYWKGFQFFVDERGCNKVVAMNHAHCGWYKKTYPHATPEWIQNKQLHDLEVFHRRALEFLPRSGEVILFYASLLPDQYVGFSRLNRLNLIA